MENLAYSVREGYNSFRRAQFSTFASTSAIVVTLALIGVFSLLGYHGNGVTTWLKQEVGEIEIFLTDHGESQIDECFGNKQLLVVRLPDGFYNQIPSRL